VRVNAEGTAIHAFRVVYAVGELAPHLYVPVGYLILLIFSDNNAPICGLSRIQTDSQEIASVILYSQE
jgi:hypothetical protein